MSCDDQILSNKKEIQTTADMWKGYKVRTIYYDGFIKIVPYSEQNYTSFFK